MHELLFKFWLGHTQKMTYAHKLEEIPNIIKEWTPDIIPLQLVWRKADGTEFFVGDIIQHGESIRFIHYINSNTTASRMELNESILLSFCSNPILIGNIFENPELLKHPLEDYLKWCNRKT